MFRILRGDGRPIALPAENIRPGNEAFQVGDLQFPPADRVPAIAEALPKRTPAGVESAQFLNR